MGRNAGDLGLAAVRSEGGMAIRAAFFNPE
jgi:hypothetical protein